MYIWFTVHMLTTETNGNQGLNLLGKWHNIQILSLGKGTGSKVYQNEGNYLYLSLFLCIFRGHSTLMNFSVISKFWRLGLLFLPEACTSSDPEHTLFILFWKWQAQARGNIRTCKQFLNRGSETRFAFHRVCLSSLLPLLVVQEMHSQSLPMWI